MKLLKMLFWESDKNHIDRFDGGNPNFINSHIMRTFEELGRLKREKLKNFLVFL